MRKNIWLIMGILVITSLLIVACGGDTADEEAQDAVEETGAVAEEVAEEAEAVVDEAEEVAEEAAPSGDKTQVRWFVGLSRYLSHKSRSSLISTPRKMTSSSY